MRGLRRAAYEREGGRCFVTGLPLGDVDGGTWDLHHRRPGGKGGTKRSDQDSLPNVVALLSVVHNFGSQHVAVHGQRGRSVHGAPAWSMPHGYLLSPASSVPPRSRPALHHEHGWVFLLERGGYELLT